MKRFKEIISILLAVVFIWGALPFARAVADSETLAATSGNDIHINQSRRGCVVSSAAMMLRRAAIINNENNWKRYDEAWVISKDGDKSLSWDINFQYVENVSPKYHVQKTSSAIKGSEQYISLLQKHPEGILLYLYESTTHCHGVLLTHYSNGTFFCLDPAKGNTGYIKLADSGLKSFGKTQEDILSSKHIERPWIITSGINYCSHEWDSLGKCSKCGANFDYQSTEIPARGSITPISGNSSYSIHFLPYSASTILQTDVKATDQVYAYYKCTNSANQIWYQVEYIKQSTIPGSSTKITGYVNSSYVDLVSVPEYVEASVSVPKVIFTQGTSQAASGTIFSTKNLLSQVKFGIYNPDGTPTQYVTNHNGLTSTSYKMTSSDDSAMRFSALAPGQYYYLAQGWDNKYDLLNPQDVDQQVRHYGYRRQDFYVNPLPQATTYNITFDGTGGAGAPSVQKVAKGSSLYLSTLPVPQNYGYVFAGWSKSMGADVPEYSSTSILKPTNDMKLYAVWNIIDPPTAPNMRTTTIHIGAGKAAAITWDASVGASNYEATVYTAENTVVKKVPSLGTQATILFDLPGTYTVRVKAKNTAGASDESATYSTVVVHAASTVTFLDYNDNLLSTQQVEYQDAAAEPTSPTRTGYNFTGWDGSLYGVTADRTLKAKYSAITYTVKFLDVKGNIAKTQSVTYNGDTPGSATPPAESELKIDPGFVLAGWDTNEYTSVTKNVTVKPAVVWGNQDVPITTNINNVSKAGDGYWVDYTINNMGTTSRMGRVVIVLKSNFGKFLTKTESGAFYLAGGATYNGNLYVPMTSTLQDEVFTTVEAYVVNNYQSLVPIAEPDTYSMVGADGDWSKWMTASEFADFTGSYTDIQTKTQYSTSTKQTYTSTLPTYLDWTCESTSTYKGPWGNWSAWQDAAISTNDYREVETQQTLVTAAYTEYNYGRYKSTDCSQGTWYHFNDKSAKSLYGGTWYPVYKGWSTTRNSITSADYGYTTTNNTLGNGVYKSGRYYWNKYTISGVNYYWEDSRTIPATYKTQYRSRTRTDITEYHFVKWTEWTNWSDTPATQSESLQVKTQTLTRVKLPDPPMEGRYSLTGTLDLAATTGKQAILTVYKVDEASDYSNEFIEQVELGQNGAYAFSFRTLEEPSIQTGDFTATLTLEGSNSPVYIGTIAAPKPKYNISFVDMDGTQIGEVQSVELGSSATAPVVPAHDGYTFIGWEYGLTNIRDNMTIRARYAAEKYTVVFADFANSMISMQTDVQYGAQLEMPDVDPPEGYVFVGWQAADGRDVDFVTGSMVVTAVYEQMKYTVRFLDSEGQVISEQVIGHGELANVPEDEIAAPEGMFFSDWSIDAYTPITQPIDIVPEVYYEEDSPMPELSLGSGIYEGEQALDITCSDATAILTYSIVHTAGALPAESSDIPVDGSIHLTQSLTIEVTASVQGKNSTSETYDYIIVPEESKPVAPINIAANPNESGILLSWDAVIGADGYIVYKTDTFGAEERFITTATTYSDENVYAINDYTYKISSYSMVGEGDMAIMVESDSQSDTTSARFFGEQYPVESILISPNEPIVTIGNTIQMQASTLPTNAYNPSVSWKVKNGTGAATISSNGLLTASRTGTVVVTATANDGGGATASTTISIIDKQTDAASLSITSDTIYSGNPGTVSVLLSEGSNASIIQFALIYDASKLVLKSCIAGSLMSSKEPTINSTIPGVIYFNWDSTMGLSTGGSLLDISFEAIEGVIAQDVLLSISTESEDPELAFIFMKLVSDEPVDINCSVLNGKISIIDVLIGDVNLDGNINVIDANMVRRYAAKMISLSANQLAAADVSGDGSVNAIDANYIRRYAAKLIISFPANVG